MEPTTREEACFEAGIKFGTIYHQFAGTPVAPRSARSLETAMEEAIENQPHCVDVEVEIRDEELERELAEGAADYTELTGRFLAVAMVIEYEGERVRTSMAMEDGYPLMRVDGVESI